MKNVTLIPVATARIMYQSCTISTFRFLRSGADWYVSLVLTSSDTDDLFNSVDAVLRATHSDVMRMFKTLDSAVRTVESITGNRLYSFDYAFVPGVDNV